MKGSLLKILKIIFYENLANHMKILVLKNFRMHSILLLLVIVNPYKQKPYSGDSQSEGGICLWIKYWL